MLMLKTLIVKKKTNENVENKNCYWSTSILHVRYSSSTRKLYYLLISTRFKC